MHLKVRHHIHLHALLENLPMWVFQVASQISMPYVKVGSNKPLNRWNLSSQHVTPTTTSFLKVPINVSYLQFFTFYLVTQSNHVNRNHTKVFIFWGNLKLVCV